MSEDRELLQKIHAALTRTNMLIDFYGSLATGVTFPFVTEDNALMRDLQAHRLQQPKINRPKDPQ